MIKVGSLCIIVKKGACPHLLGRFCTVTGHHIDTWIDWNIVEVPNDATSVYYASDCALRVIKPPENPVKVKRDEDLGVTV